MTGQDAAAEFAAPRLRPVDSGVGERRVMAKATSYGSGVSVDIDHAQEAVILTFVPHDLSLEGSVVTHFRITMPYGEARDLGLALLEASLPYEESEGSE